MKLLVFCRKALLFALPCGHTKNNLLGFLPGLLGVLTQLIVFLKNDSTYPETQRIKR